MQTMKILAGATALGLIMGSAAHAEQTNGSMTKQQQPAAGASETSGAGFNKDQVFNTDRIKLNEAQNNALFKAAADLEVQALPPHVIALPGARLPQSVTLSDIPGAVKQQFGDKLEDHKLARFDTGVAIVDPSNNEVQAVVTPDEGQAQASDAPSVDEETAFNEQPMAQQSPQTTGASPISDANANKRTGVGRAHIKLSAEQERALFEAGQDLPKQNLSQETPPAAGITLPQSVELTKMPESVTQMESGGVRMDQYALVHTAGNDVLVVDPDNRVVQAVITRQEASKPKG